MAGKEDIGPPSDAEAHLAAAKAVDRHALLEGEDPDSRHPDDADHWMNAYAELVRFKESVLHRTRAERELMTNPDSTREAGLVDLTILRAELDRYKRRLEFWAQRREEIRT